MFHIIFYTFLDGTEPFIRQRKNNIPPGSFTAAHQSVKIQRCSGRSLAKQGRSLIFWRKHEKTSGGASGAHHAAHAGSLCKNHRHHPVRRGGKTLNCIIFSSLIDPVIAKPIFLLINSIISPPFPLKY